MFLFKPLIVVAILTAQAFGNAVTQPITMTISGTQVRDDSFKAATKVARSHARDFIRGIDNGRVPIIQRQEPAQSHSTQPSTMNPRSIDELAHVLQRDEPAQSHGTDPSTMTRSGVINASLAGRHSIDYERAPIVQRQAPAQSHSTEPSTMTRPGAPNNRRGINDERAPILQRQEPAQSRGTGESTLTRSGANNGRKI